MEIEQQLKKINQYLEKKIQNYIERATGAFYPKCKKQDSSKKDDDDEPILFI